MAEETLPGGNSDTVSAQRSNLRQARPGDAEELRALIALSVRELQKNDYSAGQLAIAVKTIFTLDTQLLADGTYFVIEAEGLAAGDAIAACGGWSARAKLCGGDAHDVPDNSLLDPHRDAAKIRAFFVHPAWARRGLGSRLLAHCEQAARAAGFRELEMAATLTGVPLYLARGYRVVEETTVPMGGAGASCGESGKAGSASKLAVVLMRRSILEHELQPY